MPIWMGEALPSWVFDHRFARNLVAVVRPAWVAPLPASWQWLQFAPLVAFQVATIGLLFRGLRRALPETVRSSLGGLCPQSGGRRRWAEPTLQDAETG